MTERVKYLATFLLLTQLSLAAAVSVVSCPVPADSVILNILLSSQQTSCDVALDMAKTLTQVSQRLAMPIQLSLNITTPNNNAGFDNGVMIEIPSQYIYQTGYHQTAASGTLLQLETIVIHEFGHALLELIYRQEFASEFKILQDSFILDSQNRLDYLIRSESGNKESAFTIDTKQLARYQAFLSPYSELFADTVAVYFTHDKSALVNALYFDVLTNREIKHLQLRDFGIDHQLDNPELEYDFHSRLAPTRSFIGKYMMATDDVTQRRLIRILSDAIVIAVKKDLASTQPPSAVKANQHLIALLKSALNSK